MTSDKELKRSISLPLLIFYGLGVTVGGGIYALSGKVAGVAGLYAPFSFIISACIAMITAFSYAEMATRFPFSAGEVRYVSAAFQKKFFSMMIGWLIILTGIVSSSALANATAGFIQDFAVLPEVPLTIAIIIALGLVAIWGITESVALVAIITTIEIGGLLLIVYAGSDDLATLGTRWPEFIPPVNFESMMIWSTIFSGAFLAFYAFIGFEDIINIAEEVRDVRYTMPRGIIICIALTMVIYVLVSLVAVVAVDPQELAQSSTPLATIMDRTGEGIPPYFMGLISILATVNGVLVQIIMASRVLYGMAKGGEAHHYFGVVNDKTRTPVNATISIVSVILVFTLLFDLTTLAKLTSAIILFVFAFVNLALLKIKWTQKEENKDIFIVPSWVPLTGFLICSGMLLFQLWTILTVKVL